MARTHYTSLCIFTIICRFIGGSLSYIQVIIHIPAFLQCYCHLYNTKLYVSVYYYLCSCKSPVLLDYYYAYRHINIISVSLNIVFRFQKEDKQFAKLDIKCYNFKAEFCILHQLFKCLVIIY